MGQTAVDTPAGFADFRQAAAIAIDDAFGGDAKTRARLANTIAVTAEVIGARGLAGAVGKTIGVGGIGARNIGRTTIDAFTAAEVAYRRRRGAIPIARTAGNAKVRREVADGRRRAAIGAGGATGNANPRRGIANRRGRGAVGIGGAFGDANTAVDIAYRRRRGAVFVIFTGVKARTARGVALRKTPALAIIVDDATGHAGAMIAQLVGGAIAIAHARACAHPRLAIAGVLAYQQKA